MSVPLIVLIGPTATGKSTLAVDLALALIARGQAAEIVNADSMLVYRGMDIGTAKPSLQERRGVTHHLIDITEVTEEASVARFQEAARTVIGGLRARSVVPILVGGSPLYTRAITDQFEFPGSDEAVRARLEAELAAVGAVELHRQLAERAPASAAKIEPGNGRRTVRALEVLELTGGHQPDIPEWEYELADVYQFGLSLERAALDARIDSRVDRMWEDGLVSEVQALLKAGLREGRTAVRAIGYRQVLEYLDGETTQDQAKAAVKSKTRTFFRKQLGWYRRDPRILWLDADDARNIETILTTVDLAQGGSRDA